MNTSSVLQRVEQTVVSQNSIVPASSLLASVRRCEEEQEPPVPLFVALSEDVYNASEQQPEAVRAGLKALKCLGVWGIVLDVWWGQVECSAPRQYSWARTRAVLKLAQETGVRVKVAFNFHAGSVHALPDWVQQLTLEQPDILYADRAMRRSSEYLSLGVDHVSVLHGRTPLQAYSHLIGAFASEFRHFLGSVVADMDVGLGPGGELRYPSTPAVDERWEFPGIGEFQCYDRYMLASLQACAQQVGQPHWGSQGPHDAGTYRQWPHQSGFFHNQGSWGSDYGCFFLQWYSTLLARHADAVLAAARAALVSAGDGARSVRLHARLPLLHWWYNQPSHAAEQAAGIYNTAERDGYLQLLQVLRRHGAGVVLCGAELRAGDQPPGALADADALVRQVRAGAAALQLRVSLANAAPGSAAWCGDTTGGSGAVPSVFEPRALAELERKAFEPDCYRGIDASVASALVVHCMGDAMFEPAAWTAFKEWAVRVRARSAALRDSPTAAAGSNSAGLPAPLPTPAADLARGAGADSAPLAPPVLMHGAFAAAHHQQQQQKLQAAGQRETAVYV